MGELPQVSEKSLALNESLNQYGAELLAAADEVFADGLGVLLKSHAILMAEISAQFVKQTGVYLIIKPSTFKRALAKYESDDLEDFMREEPYLLSLVVKYHNVVYETELEYTKKLISAKTHVDLQKYQFLLTRAPKLKQNWAEYKPDETNEHQHAPTEVHIHIPAGTTVITSEALMEQRYNDYEDATTE